jgi:hypothetical protein
MTLRNGNTVTTRATGSFDVKITPLATDTAAEGSPLGRMSIDKQFHGDLEGMSKGEMLTAGTAISNSAGYVAIERVTGTLHGKRGTFVLQHNATMTRGQGSLNIIVVPDSGTGELTGLSGNLSIEITGGKHGYVFEYAID